MLLLFVLMTCFIINPFPFPSKVYTIQNNLRRNVIGNLNREDILESLTPPSGGELKLLTHLNGAAWAQNWLIHMARNDTELYDEHYCTECLRMKQASDVYTSEEYFYFGFYPEESKCGQFEPKYMAMFVLDKKRRALNAKLVVENPKFIHEETMLIPFENSLRKLCDESYVFFKYDELKRPGQIRYYYEWTFIN